VFKDAVLRLAAAVGRAHAGFYLTTAPWGRFTNHHLVAYGADEAAKKTYRQQFVLAAVRLLNSQTPAVVRACVNLGTAGVTDSSISGDFKNPLNQPLIGQIDALECGDGVMALTLLNGVYATDMVS
jgi:hypothetical protein